jgi:hypothetical protein
VSSERLPAGLEVSGLVRAIQAAGDFAAVIRKGDEERGSIILLISSRGRHIACLERTLGPSGSYSWQRVGPAESAGSAEVEEFVAKRARFDQDCWAVELDIAAPERVIVETTAAG